MYGYMSDEDSLQNWQNTQDATKHWRDKKMINV